MNAYAGNGCPGAPVTEQDFAGSPGVISLWGNNQGGTASVNSSLRFLPQGFFVVNQQYIFRFLEPIIIEN